jgi:hypothetical protein
VVTVDGYRPVKISRTLGYQFSLQDYESIKLNASATVESNDIGVADEVLLKMSDAELDVHIKDLEAFCDDMLQSQLKPLLEEADRLCQRKSSAHDVSDYHRGLGA